MIQKLLLLAAAGSLGTLARYGLAGLVHRIDGASFPWGTLAVNVTGCFLVGLLAALFESRWPVSGETRVILLVGFMGAFTTFSAYILETGELVRTAEWLRAAANVGLQNGLGFVALLVGAAIGRVV
jgi:CrcB protein